MGSITSKSREVTQKPFTGNQFRSAGELFVRGADSAWADRSESSMSDGGYAPVEASREIEKRIAPFPRGSDGNLLSRLNGKLHVRGVFAARVNDVLPTIGADVLFDRRHQRPQKVS